MLQQGSAGYFCSGSGIEIHRSNIDFAACMARCVAMSSCHTMATFHQTNCGVCVLYSSCNNPSATTCLPSSNVLRYVKTLVWAAS